MTIATQSQPVDDLGGQPDQTERHHRRCGHLPRALAGPLGRRQDALRRSSPAIGRSGTSARTRPRASLLA